MRNIRRGVRVVICGDSQLRGGMHENYLLLINSYTRSNLFCLRPTVSVTCWWAGVDSADCAGKCSGVESSHFLCTHPTSQVHAVLAR
jgi:hypothetical protein